MFRSYMSAALLVGAAPALAQRADDNAVTAAQDAFGTSIGNESIGLYGESQVRGFSPVTAGNVRLQGLYLDQLGGFTSRLIEGSTIRVGLSAQSYPFPAPTGIVDYALRPAGDEAVLSTVLYAGPYRTKAFDFDAQAPLIEGKLSLAAGAAYRFDEAQRGDTGRSTGIGIAPRWTPADGIEVRPFWGRFDWYEDKSTPLVFTDGAHLPPEIERRYYGQDWTKARGFNETFGVLGTGELGHGWRVASGLFRSRSVNLRGFADLYLGADSSGESARHLIVSDPRQAAASTSGEVRLTRTLAEGPRRHALHFSLRGRDADRVYGGSGEQDFGAAQVGSSIPLPEPTFRFSERSRDAVRRWTGGIAYEGHWREVGELSLSLSKTDYRKSVAVPGRQAVTTEDKPWLYSGTVALHLAKGLAAYGGYTRGLEESGVAPEIALNKNAAPPAIRTRQFDAGLRYQLISGLNLVAGVFDVSKPYYNVDPDRIYRELGSVRHRGVELSLAGRVAKGFSLIAGAVLMDPKVSGDAVELGLIGEKPVGQTDRLVRLNLDYRLPSVEGLSIDAAFVNFGPRTATSGTDAGLGNRQLAAPARSVVDLGARYHFRVGRAPATARVQVTNVMNHFGWVVSGSGAFQANHPRRMTASLAMDF